MFRPSVLLVIGFFLLGLITVPVRGDITGWTLLHAPVLMSELDTVTFALLSVGSDLNLLVLVGDDPNAATESISVSVNGTDVLSFVLLICLIGNTFFSGNVTAFTPFDPVINETFLDIIPAQVALEVLVELYDESGNLVNSSRLHPATSDALSFYQLVVHTWPWSTSFDILSSTQIGCAFTSAPHARCILNANKYKGPIVTLDAIAQQTDLSNTFSCATVGYDPVNLHMQAGMVFDFVPYFWPNGAAVQNGPTGTFCHRYDQRAPFSC